MYVVNVSKNTVFLEDANITILYDPEKKPIEIPDEVAKRSLMLRIALKKRSLVSSKDPLATKIDLDPESPFVQTQSMLADKALPTLLNTGVVKTAQAIPKKLPYGGSAIEKYKTEGQISVVWTGPGAEAGGYAKMNRKFMLGLAEAGVNLQYEPLQATGDIDPSVAMELRKLTLTLVPKDAPKVYGSVAPTHYDWARYKALFTMMETRRLHERYAELCNCADEIIVPSKWCKQMFLESGIRRPISVVPLGVDTTIYKKDAEPLAFTKKLNPFIFLSVFGWSMRKGYDVLLKSYLEEFTSDDPVTLLISSRFWGSADESKKKVIRDDIARVSATVRNPKKPQIILFGDVMSENMLPRLYASCDCYVLISRGEGFGLPFCEAAACGLPVIASRYSGQTDFLDDDNSYLVDVDGFTKEEGSLSNISYYYKDAEFPIFGDKAVEQTRYFMRRVFEQKEEAQEKANKLHDRVVSEYTWSNCIVKMQEKLKATYEVLTKK
jgi:glycosyltransferase involved in cell wall biosynthesis